MNIYQHVEIISRELDSKLLLGVIAASRGHQVVISDLSSIMYGIKLGLLSPGVFHTKSLTPTDEKISRHQFLVENDFAITSIDEEGGLIDHGYEKFAKDRFSDITMSQASAVFSWGPEDASTLKQMYPEYSQKVHQTGSPRADLWGPLFASYWISPNKMLSRPYLLVSSNMGLANNMRPFHEEIFYKRSAGNFLRDPELFRNHFGIVSEEYLMIDAFIGAITHLAYSDPPYDIVLRPHPTENIEAWKIYLKDIPNVHVIREGPITAWLKNSFALMHNGCTTAIEAFIANKPVITYIPFQQEYARDIPNELGCRVERLEQLSHLVDDLWITSISPQASIESIDLPEVLSKKIYIDEKELAAEKMVMLWEDLSHKSLCQPNNWRLFKWVLGLVRLRNFFRSLLRKISPARFGVNQENYKFPPLNEKDIQGRVRRLQKILGHDVVLDCELLSDSTILIRQKP